MALAERTPSLVDRVVDGRYHVRRHIAEGGMASVYLAIDERLDREVALKVMRSDLTRDPVFVERFRQEARSAARLAHPHVVSVYDQGTDADLVFLAMEYVEGATLRDLLRAQGPLSPREALRILADVLSGLAAAHRMGFIHRDVKPENVLIGDDDVVKVADFGLARATTAHTATALSGTLLGTVAYLSPEQVERDIADARSDVYGCGLVLHEMLTGRPAVEGDSPIHVAYQHVHGTIAPPSERAPGLPASLDELVLRAVRRDPDERPADAGRFLEEVRACRAGLSVAELDTAAPRPVPPGRAPAAGSDAHEVTGAAPAHAEQVTRSLERRTQPLAVTGLRRPAGSPARPRAGRAAWASGIAALTLVVLLLAGWALLSGPGAVRAVPDVVGQEQAMAAAAVGAQGFDSEVVEAYDEDVPRGTVVRTDPAAATMARPWQTVTLLVSKGPERYDVPQVVGMPLAEARAAIESSHLAVGRASQDYHETIGAGQVVSVSPPPGTSAKPGTAVEVVTSRGRQPIPLADWRGKPLADAQAALTGAGLSVEVGQERYDADVAQGAVIAQEPGPTTLHRGDVVTFVVSKGPETAPVPRVRGLAENEAKARLEQAGFSVEVSRIAGGLLGVAHSTDPSEGTQVRRGTSLTLRVV